MTALYTAIRDAYLASTLATTPLISDLWLIEAPDNAVWPYAVVQLVNGNTDEFASNKKFSENILMQFNLFSKTSDAAEILGIFAGLILCYDFAALTVGGYDLIGCVRESTMQTRVNKVWQITVTYRIRLRKN